MHIKKFIFISFEKKIILRQLLNISWIFLKMNKIELQLLIVNVIYIEVLAVRRYGKIHISYTCCTNDCQIENVRQIIESLTISKTRTFRGDFRGYLFNQLEMIFRNC